MEGASTDSGGFPRIELRAGDPEGLRILDEQQPLSYDTGELNRNAETADTSSEGDSFKKFLLNLRVGDPESLRILDEKHPLSYSADELKYDVGGGKGYTPKPADEEDNPFKNFPVNLRAGDPESLKLLDETESGDPFNEKDKGPSIPMFREPHVSPRQSEQEVQMPNQ